MSPFPQMTMPSLSFCLLTNVELHPTEWLTEWHAADLACSLHWKLAVHAHRRRNGKFPSFRLNIRGTSAGSIPIPGNRELILFDYYFWPGNGGKDLILGASRLSEMRERDFDPCATILDCWCPTLNLNLGRKRDHIITICYNLTSFPANIRIWWVTPSTKLKSHSLVSLCQTYLRS